VIFPDDPHRTPNFKDKYITAVAQRKLHRQSNMYRRALRA